MKKQKETEQYISDDKTIKLTVNSERKHCTFTILSDSIDYPLTIAKFLKENPMYKDYSIDIYYINNYENMAGCYGITYDTAINPEYADTITAMLNYRRSDMVIDFTEEFENV